MNLTFSASQDLLIPVNDQPERLVDYLADERRIIEALLDPRQLIQQEAGRYRYEVAHLQVFQLPIHPVVELQAIGSPGRLDIDAIDACLLYTSPSPRD